MLECIKNIKNKLSQMDTAFFVIDGKPYALSLRNGQEGNCDDINELAPMIKQKYFDNMIALAEKEEWNVDDEMTLAQCGSRIFLFLKEYNCTPEKTLDALNSFNDEQLNQLASQLDVYFRIRPLYCKYKVIWHSDPL